MTMLSHRRILIVEDEYFLADDMARALTRAGAEVVGPCRTEEAALDLIQQDPGIAGAVVDINLGEGPSFAVAEALTERGVPFVFGTGYGPGAIPPHLADRPRWEKPYDPEDLTAALAEVVAETVSGGG